MEKKTDFKKMTKTQIVKYIWDYYKLHIFVGIVIIFSVVSLVKHFMTYQDPVVTITLLNCNTMDIGIDPDMTEFMNQNGYDLKKEKVSIDTGYYIDLESNSSSDMYTLQALQTLLSAGGIDVIAGTEEIYQYMGEKQSLATLEEFLSEELIAKYADDLIYIEDQETGESYPGGIRIPNNWWMTQYRYYEEDCIIGITRSCQNTEAAVQLLKYILQE